MMKFEKVYMKQKHIKNKFYIWKMNYPNLVMHYANKFTKSRVNISKHIKIKHKQEKISNLYFLKEVKKAL